jgi:hypothetical protein
MPRRLDVLNVCTSWADALLAVPGLHPVVKFVGPELEIQQLASSGSTVRRATKALAQFNDAKRGQLLEGAARLNRRVRRVQLRGFGKQVGRQP